MFSFSNRKVSLESYKGVRDFYPEDQAIQNYIFSIMRQTAEAWGYVEYNASVLEPAELYKAKTSEEIVSEQTYTFEDRGGREVTLRPEMTPTVSRMVAARSQELPQPIRWYSIPNLFRYEKPQRGRLREHWQLNVDLFGATGVEADAEVVALAHNIMKNFGANQRDFEIRLNSRRVLDDLFVKVEIDEGKRQEVYRALDKKEKLEEQGFIASIEGIIGREKTKNLLEMLYYGEALLTQLQESETARYLNSLFDTLRSMGVKNVVYKPTLTRGFDYYTGVVFEVFDMNRENPRSLFGGGRYDNLIGAFIKESIPAFGFGMGDVTIRDFLTTHNILPKLNSTTDVWIVVAPDTPLLKVYEIANKIRENGLRVGVDISGKKLGDQILSADKRKIPIILSVGQNELESRQFTIRRLSDRAEKSGSVEEIPSLIKELL